MQIAFSEMGHVHFGASASVTSVPPTSFCKLEYSDIGPFTETSAEAEFDDPVELIPDYGYLLSI